MFNRVVKELKVLGAVDYIKVKTGLKETRELKASQQYKLGYNQREGVKEEKVVDYTITDPYNLRSLRFNQNDIGSIFTIRTLLRREEHGNVFMSTEKNPYTNVVVRYLKIVVIDETKCNLLSVKEVREYIEPSKTKGGCGI